MLLLISTSRLLGGISQVVPFRLCGKLVIHGVESFPRTDTKTPNCCPCDPFALPSALPRFVWRLACLEVGELSEWRILKECGLIE